MNINDLGFTDEMENFKNEQNLSSFEIGRIISEHKERYIIKTPDKEFSAELIGNMRFSAISRYDLPAVGDWVAFTEYDDGKGLIHKIFPRHSILERKAVGKATQVQIIATNIDYGLIVQSANRDFNLNRLERYLVICNASKVNPIIVLSKVDLVNASELESIVLQIRSRINHIPIITVSNQTIGYDQMSETIQPRKTYCLLGSSGVGKSTLLNHLSGKEQMKTGEISTSVNKGRHITSHRELFILENGGILIDNPGMREIGVSDSTEGVELTFDAILEIAIQCRFKDCSHIHETGCAVLAAVEKGEIEEEAYSNYMKIEKEKSHFETNTLKRRQKDKSIGKMIKNIQKERRKNKY